MKISGPKDFAEAVSAFRNPLFERAGIALLKNGEIIKAEITGVGNVMSTNVGIDRMREILRANPNADGFMVWHNHPSGKPDPSPRDREVTHVFKKIGEEAEVPFLDHIITNGDKFFSFTEHAILSMSGAPHGWETARRGHLREFGSPADLREIAGAVRAKDGTGTIALLLNIRHDIVAAKIVPEGTGLATSIRLSRRCVIGHRFPGYPE